MIKINTKIDKNMNFLMIVYQILKKQNLFEKLNFVGIDNLKKEDTALVKKYLRGNQDFDNFLRENEQFEKFYNLNRGKWDTYWENNKESLEKIKDNFARIVGAYDFSIFEKVESFFEKQGAKEIDFFIFMGNEEIFGTGNAYTPKYATIFPRNFKNYTQKMIEQDFAVLIHEIFHLYQNSDCGENKELIEKVARFFAPRGILINEEKMELNEKDKLIYDFIKKSFDQEKKYREIEEELIELVTG